ncbi:hypothetical protein QL285_020875 [Trifolium repens]|nr:hypothetical protein QL285_020875 [Trifolium repens]
MMDRYLKEQSTRMQLLPCFTARNQKLIPGEDERTVSQRDERTVSQRDGRCKLGGRTVFSKVHCEAGDPTQNTLRSYS